MQIGPVIQEQFIQNNNRRIKPNRTIIISRKMQSYAKYIFLFNNNPKK